MLVMTAKLNKKKTALILSALIVAIAALIVLIRGGSSEQTVSTGVSDNDSRVQYLQDLGWKVTVSPVESGQVRIPKETSEIFDRYNELQKSMGYDLTQYAGKTVTRYVYLVNNYPGATEPVYATLLIYKDQIIGGDVTDTSAKGKIQSFRFPASSEG